MAVEQSVIEADPNHVYSDFASNTDECNVSVAESPDSPSSEQLLHNRHYPMKTRKAPDCLNL